ncbi:DNA mismatch repair endonuclease MutL [Candidatus Avelusimicrobium luingense]|uniref:DNA mismatch repair endonuclease MutL n=1 Tax=Candidatus Avelusimicrobium luingense TaxID=3416211 RepID=UPI003D0F7078
MSKIHVLDSATAAKIAAGEVIERPAGVLKELLENAVDAGATAVRIDIDGSGKELIRINDNGCGMDADDLAACALRHATSKIQAFTDLEKLQTFGFRGEALYSVAAVSRMTLTSCTGESGGHTLEIHAGEVVSQRPAPAIKGTTVQIRDLFYNTPARLKFLKSDSYERACLLKVIEESALANLSVAYRVYINGREVYNLPAQNGPTEQAVIARAAAILGEEVAASLVYKSFDKMGLHLFVTPVEKLVNVRDMQYVFVNRRPIDSKTVSQAIYKAYQNARPKDRHPAFIVYMTLNPDEFDVNIHPQKRDIRFINENQVFGFLMHSAGETIFSHSRPVEVTPAPSVTLPQQAQPAAGVLLTPTSSQEPVSAEVRLPKRDTTGYNLWTEKPVDGLHETETPEEYRAEPFSPQPIEKPISAQRQEQTPVVQNTSAALPQEKAPQWFVGPYHYLGQLHRTYLLFENPEGLILIDQHAAQERVLFEHYLEAFEQHQVAVQKLLFPLHVDLPPSNVETLLSWGEWLKSAGFEISPFSVRTVAVHTRPHVIRFHENDLKEFIVSLAQLVGDPTKSTETLKRKMVAMLACKKAIKAHDQISAAEAEALIENMKKCKDGMHCPHGRPCVAQVALKDIGKLFGR